MELNTLAELKLVNALTAFDMKEAKKKNHNPYALSHYLNAVKSVANDMKFGCPTLRKALLVNFSGRLLSCVLKAVDEVDFTREEMLYECRRTWQLPDTDE